MNFLNKDFWNAIRHDPFPGRLSNTHIRHIENIVGFWVIYGDGDDRKLAYILATTFHETAGTMEPITEYGSTAYLKAKRYWPFVGRGYVQLTWEANYRDWSKRLGVDLVKKPKLALDMKIAGRVLVQGSMLGTFTGKKLGDYISGDSCDFKGARRVINGTDRAALIASYAEDFLHAIRKGRNYAYSHPAPVPAPKPKVPVPVEPVAAGGVAILATLGAFLYEYWWIFPLLALVGAGIVFRKRIGKFLEKL